MLLIFDQEAQENMTPDIIADIQWIKTALDQVHDPYLIDVFKSLLLYHEKTNHEKMVEMILEGEKAYREGRVHSGLEVSEIIDSWRKK